jgi:hypothetical protein
LGLDEYIRQTFEYFPLTGEIKYKRDRRTWAKRGDLATARRRDGYEHLFVMWGERPRKKKQIVAHRVAWFLMTGAWPEGVIDHVDGDRANNRWANLRDVTTKMNNANRAFSYTRQIVRYANKYFIVSDGYDSAADAERELRARECLF